MSATDPTASAYWPPSWSRTRLVNSSSSDLLALPDDERDRMYDSLRTLLGPDGFKALLREMSTNYQARLAAEDEQQQQQPELPPRLRAPFLATLERLYPDPGNANGWGFVVYRLAAHGDERLWAALRERWDGIVRERLRNYEGVPGVAEAVQQIEFRWIEYGELEGATLGTVANLLTQQTPLPPGLAHPICLAITPSSLSSVLSSPPPSSAPLSDRKSIPFAVAIDKSLDLEPPSDQDGAQAGQEGSGAPRFFNVAVESLLDELFPVVGGDVMSVDELAVGVGPKQVWVSGGGRHGVYEMED